MFSRDSLNVLLSLLFLFNLSHYLINSKKKDDNSKSCVNNEKTNKPKFKNVLKIN